MENGTILDLDTRDFSQHLEQSKSLLFKFIDQFEEVKTRWRNKYEEGTFLLIASAARYQKELLAPYTRVSADKQDEATLIATLLRCLVMADDIFAVDMYWSTLIILKKSEVRELRSEANTDYWGLESSVTVQPIPRSSRRSIQAQVRKYPQGLPTTLKRAIAVVQQVMFKRRPQDLPYLIYSLVLLDLIVLALQPWAKFMVPVAEAGDDVQGILKTLCDLYLFCSDNMHPLSEGFDISKYEALVDSDTIAVEHFQALNQRWKETGTSFIP